MKMKSPWRVQIKYKFLQPSLAKIAGHFWCYLLLIILFQMAVLSMAIESKFTGAMRPAAYFLYSQVLDSWQICALNNDPTVATISLPQLPKHIPDLPGAVIPWTPVIAQQQVIDPKVMLTDLGELPGNALFFAYTNYYSSTRHTSQLQLSSAGAIAIWLNGQKLKIIKNDCLIDVSLLAGNNSLLVRIKPTISGCNFSLRFLPNWNGEITTLPGKVNDAISIYPQLTTYRDNLTIRSDYGPRGWSTREQVKIEVYAPGLQLVAQENTARGASITFDTSEWLEGPYQIRATLLSPQPYPTIGHAIWYRGDPFPAVSAILDQEPLLDTKTILGMKRKLIIDVLHEILGGKPNNIPSSELKTVIALLLEWKEYDIDERGENGTVHASGMVRLAYRDPVDDSPQFARAFLPANYDPQQKWPLVIMLHGMRGSNPPYISYVAFDRRSDVFADRFNTIILYPFGRGNTFYQGIGDADIMTMIRLAQKTLNIDDSRIYLTGYSMGGAGSWHIGSHYPEIFAAIAPIYGGREYSVTYSAKVLRNLTTSEQYRLERLKSSFANIESLLSTPIFVNHGVDDTTVPIAISRFGVSLLQQWEYDIRYWEHPGKGHVQPLGCENELFGWLLAHRLQRFPSEVRIRASDLRYSAAHWARITQRERPGQMMELRVRIFAPNIIRLETKNVSRVTLTLPAELADLASPITIIWNEMKAIKVIDEDGTIHLSNEEIPADVRQKNAACEGPISDIYNTPFALVVGTISPNPAMVRACAQVADAIVKRWDKNQHWQPRIFLDTTISRQEIDDYSLILIGGEYENAISAQIAAKLPVVITKTAITIDEQKIYGPKLALQMIYPNPYNPTRYVLLLAANSPTIMSILPTLPDDIDFAISDGKETPWLMGGFFTTDWRCDQKYIEWGHQWQ